MNSSRKRVVRIVYGCIKKKKTRQKKGRGKKVNQLVSQSINQSIIKHHQRRIQQQRHKSMRHDHDGQRDDSNRLRNLPTPGGKRTEVDHATDDGQERSIHPLETLEDLGHLLEEIRVSFLLGCRAPGQLDAEHVREDGQV